MPPAPGNRLGPYEILARIGEGGMGVVWKARDMRLDRLVALKFLPADRMGDVDRRQRFVQEAKTASALNHPNIVTIYEIGQVEGADFIAMEFVPGKPLDRLIPQNGMRLNEVLKYAIQIADALAAAHAAGIIHRDLKLANVMVNENGLVKVLDFGLAKLTEPGGTGGLASTQTMAAAPKTEDGKIVGTVSYMSPEQAEAKKVDAQSDIFSFGALLYEMLTGRRAFRGDSDVHAGRHPEPRAGACRAAFQGDPAGSGWRVHRVRAYCEWEGKAHAGSRAGRAGAGAGGMARRPPRRHECCAWPELGLRMAAGWWRLGGIRRKRSCGRRRGGCGGGGAGGSRRRGLSECTYHEYKRADDADTLREHRLLLAFCPETAGRGWVELRARRDDLRAFDGQVRCRVQVAATRQLAFAGCVPCILARSAQPQMIGVNAQFVIGSRTIVAHVPAFRDWAEMKLP